MKNSITFLFTFIILAIGAVFTAPKCKAFDSVTFDPVSDSWGSSYTEHAVSLEIARLNASEQFDNLTADDVYIFECKYSSDPDRYQILMIVPYSSSYVPNIYIYPAPNSIHFGILGDVSSSHDCLMTTCHLMYHRGEWSIDEAWSFVTPTTETYHNETYSLLPLAVNYRNLGPSYAWCNFRGNIFIDNNASENYPSYYFTPVTPLIYDSSPSSVNSGYSPTNFRALFQGSFDITYIDDDNGNTFPVQVYSSWYNKNGNETEILRLGIVDSNSTGWSYNGHFHFSPRVSNLTAFRWLIGSVDYETIDDFELPTINNSSYSLSYHLTLFSNDTSSVQTGVPYSYTSTNKYNIDIGNGDVRYKGFKDSFIASQFDSEFTSPEVCSYFFFDSIDYYPYNCHVPTYILDGDIHGDGVKVALENTKIDDETRSYHPVTFTGDTVPVDFPDFSLDNFDFSGINSLFGALFDNWYILVLTACISVGIVGYVLFGKN